MRVAKVVITLGAVLLIVGGFFTYAYLNPSGHDPTRTVILDVSPGRNYHQVARELESAGVLTDARKFLVLVKLMGQSQKLRVGEYELEHRQPPLQVLEKITSGKSLQRRFTIPEGYNIYEVAELMASVGLGERESLLALLKESDWASELVGENVETLEGYLFPETYSYTKYTPVRTLIREMVDQFHSTYAQVSTGKSSPLTRHELVTLASIIEKETAVPAERGRIAAVFFNRLQKRMRLQTDPTIIYGILDEGDPAPDRIRYKDLRRATRYNTYTISGLPPGPIANPGRESLAAAFEPDGSEYLYFVSRNDGSHYFSKTYKEHNEAVQKYQVRGERD